MQSQGIDNGVQLHKYLKFRIIDIWIGKLEKFYLSNNNLCDIFLHLEYCSDDSRVVEKHFPALRPYTSRKPQSHLIQSESPTAPTSYFQQNGLRSVSQKINRSVTHPHFVSARHYFFTAGPGDKWKRNIPRSVRWGVL